SCCWPTGSGRLRRCGPEWRSCRRHSRTPTIRPREALMCDQEPCPGHVAIGNRFQPLTAGVAVGLMNPQVPERALVLGHGLHAAGPDSATIATPHGVDVWRDVTWDFDRATKSVVVHAAEGDVQYRYIGFYVWQQLN